MVSWWYVAVDLSCSTNGLRGSTGYCRTCIRYAHVSPPPPLPLQQVACSSEGASFLLEAGVVERLAESEGVARASQIATEATKLAALGVANVDVSARCCGSKSLSSGNNLNSVDKKIESTCDTLV